MFGRFFRKPKRVEGKCVDLMLDQHIDASKYNQMVPSDLFGIYLHGTNIRVGSCDLRYGMNEELYYAGNIGYNVLSVYRGHGYAYQACLLLFEVAKQKGMEELIITCSPDNIPSRKTLEKLNGTLEGTVNVPPDHWLYRRGETVKNIYRYRLL